MRSARLDGEVREVAGGSIQQGSGREGKAEGGVCWRARRVGRDTQGRRLEGEGLECRINTVEPGM